MKDRKNSKREGIRLGKLNALLYFEIISHSVGTKLKLVEDDDFHNDQKNMLVFTKLTDQLNDETIKILTKRQPTCLFFDNSESSPEKLSFDDERIWLFDGIFYAPSPSTFNSAIFRAFSHILTLKPKKPDPKKMFLKWGFEHHSFDCNDNDQTIRCIEQQLHAYSATQEIICYATRFVKTIIENNSIDSKSIELNSDGVWLQLNIQVSTGENLNTLISDFIHNDLIQVSGCFGFNLLSAHELDITVILPLMEQIPTPNRGDDFSLFIVNFPRLQAQSYQSKKIKEAS